MPEITLSIPCRTYLAQWYINDSGGSNPIRLRKNSPESNLLRVILQNKKIQNAGLPAVILRPTISQNVSRTPAPAPDSGLGSEIEIIIPHYPGMPPETYNRLTPRGEKVFTDLLRKRFDLQLFQDMIPILQYADRRDELIWAWMESHAIELTETNYLAIEKRLQRMINRLRTRQRVADYRRRKRSSQS